MANIFMRIMDLTLMIFQIDSNMKILLFFIFFFLINPIKGQKIKKEEYEIYLQELDNIDNNQFQLGIPLEYNNIFSNLVGNDPIFQKIKILPIKKWDSLSPYIINRKKNILDGKFFSQLKINPNKKIYFSPIFFENSNTGYFLQVIEDQNLPKPIYLFLKAQKMNKKWKISNYYDFLQKGGNVPDVWFGVYIE